MKTWTVNLYGVKELEEGKVEMPLNQISKEELKRIAADRNEKALRAAGYYPVAQRRVKAAGQ